MQKKTKTAPNKSGQKVIIDTFIIIKNIYFINLLLSRLNNHLVKG